MLSAELKDMYKLREMEIVPVLVSKNGLVTIGWQEVRQKWNCKKSLHEQRRKQFSGGGGSEY